MPSADDRCASCGCPGFSKVITSPIAEMPGHAGPEFLVDPDVAAIQLQAGFFGAETGRHRTAAGRHEQVLGVELRRLAVGRLRFDIDAVGAGLRARDLRAGQHLDALLLERLLELGRDRFVFDGTMPRQQLDDVTSLPKRRKIDANSTPTAPLPMIAIDFGISFRWIASSLVMIRLRSISMPGTLRGCRAGGDDDLLARVSVCFSPVGDLDLAVAGKPAAALDPVDLVLLEQQLDAAGQPLDDLVLARVHLRHVDADRRLADRQAPLLPVLRDLQRVRVLEQRLGRDAAPVEAGAAEHRRPFDDRGLEPELRGADRGDIAAGAGADHDDVVFVSHSVFFIDESGTNAT